MKLCIVGTGYVGLVAGTCFAEYGNQVHCVDIDSGKIERLKEGILPIYEPGLDEMVRRNHQRGRLIFTTNLEAGIQASDIVFVAVGTPGKADGHPDISGVLAVAEAVGRHANGPKLIVNKSTVPVGMADMVIEAAQRHAKHRISVVSNPEFLREGHAIEDFMKPERVVIGADNDDAFGQMKALYAPFVKDTLAPVLTMNIKSAELTKYACNSFLAMKISFANVMANLCDQLGADYNDVKRGLQTDSRIGDKFLNAGIGYGGSCFPKDVRALVQLAQSAGESVPLLEKVEETNERQKMRLFEKVQAYYRQKNPGEKPLAGLRFAVWGLAFKPGTDDMREAPSITMIRKLREAGAEVAVNDPAAEETSKTHIGQNTRYGEMYSILEDADALLIFTEWSQYREPDFDRIKKALKVPLIFDGRNIYEGPVLRKLGIQYVGMGIGAE